MITIVNGTNRSENLSQIIAKYYQDELEKLGASNVHYLTLEDLPSDLLHPLMFTMQGRSQWLTDVQAKYIFPAEKFLFVLPEYNGGMSGALKLFIDACSTHRKDDNFMDKKVGMIGIAAGRAGNLRGMEHLTGVMNYLGALVMPNKLPISSINGLIDPSSLQITDKPTMDVLKSHAHSFLDF